MKRVFVCLVAAFVAASLMIAGCAPAAPAPAPTGAPAVPTKAVEPSAAPAAPTKAAAPEPTARPAQTVDYPTKGKAITMIVPFAAGGNTDNIARAVAGMLEKDLGNPVEVVNNAGAGSQVGTTAIVKAKPDGYTIGVVSIPTGITIYLDPERKAAYARKDLETLAMASLDPLILPVLASSPYQTVKDLVDAAKANPGKIKPGLSGVWSAGDLGIKQLEKEAGVRFTPVYLSDAATAVTALLGGHVDFGAYTVSNVVSQVKSGNVRVIGTMGEEESPYLPGVKSLVQQGYKVVMASANGVVAPVGIPAEILDILGSAIKRAVLSDELKKRTQDMYVTATHKDRTAYGAFWDDLEARVRPLLAEGVTK